MTHLPLRAAGVLIAATLLGGGCAGAGGGLASSGPHLPAAPSCRAADFAGPAAPATPSVGCWNAANLARMAADPRDLAVGRPLGPADGPRETKAVEAYRTGPARPSGQGSSPAAFVIGAPAQTGSGQ